MGMLDSDHSAGYTKGYNDATKALTAEVEAQKQINIDLNNNVSAFGEEIFDLKAALEDLVDLQNGPPLVRNTNQWNEIMEGAYKLLGRECGCFVCKETGGQ